MKCPYCNTPIEEGDRFCNECGADLSQLKRCPHCNAFIEKGDKFCNNCGADISSVLGNVAANPSSDAPIMQPRIASAIDDDDDFEEKSFFEKYKIFIIVGAILVACVIGFFIYNEQTPKPTSLSETPAVDSVADFAAADSTVVDNNPTATVDSVTDCNIANSILDDEKQKSEKNLNDKYIKLNLEKFMVQNGLCFHFHHEPIIERIYESDVEYDYFYDVNMLAPSPEDESAGVLVKSKGFIICNYDGTIQNVIEMDSRPLTDIEL